MRRQGRCGNLALARAALNDDRLRLVAQPIVDLRSGQLVAETLQVLIRRFDVAADLGFEEIDAWTAGRAAYLAASGRHVHVSPCSRSVCSSAFSTCIAVAVARAGADAGTLTFEIDEELATFETEAVAQFASRIATVGAGVAIVDFSLRHGPPHYFARIPAPVVKIDPLLVERMHCDAQAFATVERIVEFAHGLGKQTVAEGVDDPATLPLLRHAGIDCVQGYGLGWS